MTQPVWWWVLAGVLVAVELASGTFYLLMLALGVAAGALAAHAGLALHWQVALAAAVGGMAVCLCYVARRHRPGMPSARADRSVNLDIGGVLHVNRWQPDGTAQVRYRGATWAVVWVGDGAPRVGRCQIVELQGSRLLLRPYPAPGGDAAP